jgi:hypothetical protein
MNAYPGLIDMENSAPLETGGAAAQGAGGGRGGAGAAAAPTFATLEEAERAKARVILAARFHGRGESAGDETPRSGNWPAPV